MEPVRRAPEEPSSEAVEFVRFCYRRRRAGWPELYDEMCAVAGRGLYQGWTHEDLAEHGIGFTLSQMPALAVLVRRVAEEECPRRVAAPDGVTNGSPQRPDVEGIEAPSLVPTAMAAVA